MCMYIYKCILNFKEIQSEIGAIPVFFSFCIGPGTSTLARQVNVLIYSHRSGTRTENTLVDIQ